VRHTVGLGTFPFASPFHAVTAEEASEVLRCYLRSGRRYVDTSPTYAFGAVEALLGRDLAGVHDAVISTSCGYVREGDVFRISGRPDDVREDLRGSLDRLGRSTVSMYMSHLPDLDTPLAETARALGELRDAGVVECIGVSNVTARQLEEYLKGSRIDYVQNRLSVINRELDPELVSICRDRGIGIVAYQVIERGLLVEDHDPTARLRTGDLRSRKPEWRSEVRAVLAAWVERSLRPVGERHGLSTGGVAVAWALSQPAVEMAQVGASNPARLLPLLEAESKRGDADLIAGAEHAYEELENVVRERGFRSVRQFTGLEEYSVYGGSASGR
jgi:aryl-alcohol dehydrogenase-like predicted oxidoreductase